MNTNFKKEALATALIVLFCAAGVASDWTQFRGPNHDGSTDEKILKNWPATGLHELWKVPMTDGFSAFAIGNGKAFTLVTREVDGAKQEVCVALDARTG